MVENKRASARRERANALLDKMAAAYKRTLEGYRDLAKHAVVYIDKYPEWLEDMYARFPDVPVHVWPRIEENGRGKVDFRFMFYDDTKYDVLKKLPKHEQARVADGGTVDVVSSGKKVRECPRTMSADKLKQVYDLSVPVPHERTIAEQRRYIKNKKVPVKAHIRKLPAKVNADAPKEFYSGDMVFFLDRNEGYTPDRLLKIVDKMTRAGRGA